MDTNDSHKSDQISSTPEELEAVDNTPISELPQYQVSEDFNSRLLDRIAQERFAETRSESHLPKFAPRFMRSQLVQTFAVAALAVFTTVMVLDQNKEPQLAQVEDSSSESVGGSSQFSKTYSTPALAVASMEGSSERSLGADLGLSDEYMTAQPIDNPVLAGERSGSSANQMSGRQADGLALTSDGSSPYRTNNQWHFARELERARRFIEISNMLGSGHTYFEVVRLNVQHPGMVYPQGSFVIQFGSPVQNRASGKPQIILQPQSVPAAGPQNPAGRMVGGSF